MAQQVLLDLARVDVLAAADQHVLDPADDVRVALGIDRRQVAGVHPAGGVDRLARARLVLPVAAHDRVAARAELAGGADRTIRPAPSTIFTSRCGWIRPTVETRRSSGSSRLDWNEIGDVSVMP
jgi:hypothetical protein